MRGARPAVVPIISGRAWITGVHQYMLDPDDPWPQGYRLSDTWPMHGLNRRTGSPRHAQRATCLAHDRSHRFAHRRRADARRHRRRARSRPGPLAERRERFRRELDRFRSAVVNEPRGSRRRGRRAARAARRPVLRRRRHLLQQRRLPRHVRPRHDRPGGHARPPRAHRAGRPPDRDARRAPSRATLHRGRRRVTSSNVPSYRTRRRSRSTCRARRDRAATWRGAATGSSSSRTTARSWRSQRRPA